MTHAVQAETKLEIALRGLRIDDSARPLLADGDAAPNSLEVLLDGALRVSAPIDLTGAAAAPFHLAGDRGRYWLTDPARDASRRIDVQIATRPRFYGRRTSSGIPMRRLASVIGDTLLVHPGGTCGFSAQGGPCRFCVEGARGRDTPLGSVADIVDVVRAAFEEGVAELVLLNSDAFEVETGGLDFLMPYVETIRRHFDTLVALQVHPPRGDRWIEWAYAQGVDAISFNLEISIRTCSIGTVSVACGTSGATATWRRWRAPRASSRAAPCGATSSSASSRSNRPWPASMRWRGSASFPWCRRRARSPGPRSSPRRSPACSATCTLPLASTASTPPGSGRSRPGSPHSRPNPTGRSPG